MALGFRFDNSYARLPERFFEPCRPTPVAAPRLLQLNDALAETLGLDPAALAGPDGVAALAGNAVPEGAAPIALAYAGHQFGQFVPRLGDGRAVLLGEVVGRDGVRRDIQLKGSGPTPFSRRGDGRAALGPVLREYLVSEAMHALGIPTTRALAALSTGEVVQREEPRPGGVLVRVAASHLRVGSFQFFAAQGDRDGLQRLTDHAIARHYSELAAAQNPARALLEAVVARQAELVARWLLVGFVHGVMNTDNTSISGETIDFGPCAFLDAYDPRTVFSSIDYAGRYSYGNQPRIAQWNLARLAEALLPLFAEAEDAAVAAAEEVLAGFAPRFEATYLDGLQRKIGLSTSREGDGALVRDLLGRMQNNGADFTLMFRRLAEAAVDPEHPGARALFADPAAFDGWAEGWRQRLAAEPGGAEACSSRMLRVNPAFIPRNHLVEAALDAAVQHGDLGPFSTLHAVLSRPFEEAPGTERFTLPARPEERVLQTFCGT